MRCHSNKRKINISSHIYLSIYNCYQSLIIIWNIIHAFCLHGIGTTVLVLAFPTNWRTVSPWHLQVHLEEWQPVLQSHLKTWMSLFAAGKRSLCKLQPCGHQQSSSPIQSVQIVWIFLPQLYLEKDSKGVVFIAAAVGGTFFASYSYFELLGTYSWKHE